MIYVKDDYLGKGTFESLRDYCYSTPFTIKEVGGKAFSVLETPEPLLKLFQIEGHNLILSFIRSAYKDFDTDLRIHADGIINKQRTALASVLYISDIPYNGTAFFKNHKYGKSLPEDISEEEFNRLIIEESNEKKYWEQTDVISGYPNRLLMYDANYFHAKWPPHIYSGTRIVLVNFYAKIK